MSIPYSGPTQHFVLLEPGALSWRQSGRGVRLATHFLSVPMLRLDGATLQLTYMFPWRLR